MLIPVVSAKEMHRLDQLALKAGCREEDFIATVGEKVALILQERSSLSSVLLLIGKGNKGADGYATGIALLAKGIRVKAIGVHSLDSASPMNQLFRRRFLEKGGKEQPFQESDDAPFVEASMIVDALLGTGFQGAVEGAMSQIIAAALRAKKPILSIDIPSGLDGTTGEVKGIAIRAEETVALGAFKMGFFLRSGWNHVGKLHFVDFGLPPSVYKQAAVLANVPTLETLRHSLPCPVRNRHKYEAGYVVGLSGSKLFRGAPKLAGLAALRAGAGIVRVFHREEIGDAPMELICQKFSSKAWKEESKRARALFLGPGLGTTLKIRRILKQMPNIPLVVDADAIQEGIEYPRHAILTPHRGEVLRLLGLKKDTNEEDLLARCQKWVQHSHTILVLKGAPTFIFVENHPPFIIPRGDPGMAKAGVGDVLTGILAALLAQRMNPQQAAIVAVFLHAIAGEMASMAQTSYGVIASDIIAMIPCALRRLH